MKLFGKILLLVVIISSITFVITIYIHNYLIQMDASFTVKAGYCDVLPLRDALISYKEDNGQYPSEMQDLQIKKDYYLQDHTWNRIFENNMVRYFPLSHDNMNDGFVLIVEANPKRKNATFVVV